MGNSCQSKKVSKDEIYYYKNLDQNITAETTEAKQKVKLTISLLNIQDTNQRKISLLIYENKSRLQFRVQGETEYQSKNNENKINFNQFFIMEYYFEKEQPMGINIQTKSNSKGNIVETSLGSIMGSRGQKFTKQLNDNSTLEIKCTSINDINMKANFNVNINGNFNAGMGIGYYIKYYGLQNSPLNNIVYRSEVKEFKVNTNQIFYFPKTTIPIMYLAPDGKYENNIISIEINDILHNKKLGESTNPLSTFISKKTNINLPNNSNAIIEILLEREYSFLDYLKGGMEINLTIAIDFTSSNLDPKRPDSLHYIGTNQMNAYEKAIRSCGDIVGYYDADQLFPVYGYGAILPNENQVSHIFPINGNINDPNINTIDNVLLTYRQILPYLKLYGPTFFAPIINELNRNVKEDLSQGKTMNYNILMILTDGLINDMDETIDALVEASYLPMSVIIIGIGYGDFGNMDILDADENPLFDKNGRKADRDLVQFVPFYKFSNSDGDKLAEQVLEEVPRQVVEYYLHNKIYPGDPVMNIS